MKRQNLILLIGVLVLAGLGTTAVIYLSDWKKRAQLNAGDPLFGQLMALLNAAEQQYGIPTDLLARQAFQESSFDPSVIYGGPNSAGAVGLMQLEPQYYPGVNPNDPGQAITAAASTMAGNFKSLGSWGLALAAYDAGIGNVEKYGGIPPFPETQNYVSQILSDVNAEGGAQIQ
jgi:soluble lytic murein transglycosylase-like protein